MEYQREFLLPSGETIGPMHLWTNGQASSGSKGCLEVAGGRMRVPSPPLRGPSPQKGEGNASKPFFSTLEERFSNTGPLEAFALVATTLSVGLFYAVCLHDLYPDWKSRFKTLPMMISLGVGMCLSNSRAVWQGLSGHWLEFRRTPKYSVIHRDPSWKRKQYRGARPGAGVIEMLFALYFLLALEVAIATRQWISLPFICLFGAGYGYVALLTAMHSLGSWPRSIFSSTFFRKTVPSE